MPLGIRTSQSCRNFSPNKKIKQKLQKTRTSDIVLDQCKGDACNDKHCTAKEVEYCPKCPICTQNTERKVSEQYKVLKNEYERICSQEAALRSHIALLGAELILMQTKQYHKSPSQINRKLSIDPIEIRRLNGKYSHCDLTPVKPIPSSIGRTSSKTSSQQYLNYAHRKQNIPVAVTKLRRNKSNIKQSQVRGSQSEKLDKKQYAHEQFPPITSKSEYDRIPQKVSYMYIDPPRAPCLMAYYRKPPVEFVTYHRLPKMRTSRMVA